MNIGMIHFRVGETDGVSLEMDKWKRVLENNGHKVYYIAGTAGTSDAVIIPEMDYRGKEDGEINALCFEDRKDVSDEVIKEKVIRMSERVEKQLLHIIEKYELALLIPNNLLSLGRSPHIAMAISNACMKTGVEVIGHHHDFYWERAYFNKPQTDYIKGLLEDYFPPLNLGMKHVVINTLARKDLKAKKGCDSYVVPNVFDFTVGLWQADDYNATYKVDMGIGDNEVVFLQATRVTNRKAIELAVDLIAMLNRPSYRAKLIGKTLYNGLTFDADTKLTLAMVGLHEGGNNYEEKLISYAKGKEVNMLVKPDLIMHTRHTGPSGGKVYSLWDAYVHCDIITYPSIYEGWGNQFLEGIFAKKAQVVFEYSVFESDIKQFEFDYISLGNTYTVKENSLAQIDEGTLMKAADEVIAYLTDPNKYQKSVDKNFDIAKKYLSMEALEALLKKIVG